MSEVKCSFCGTIEQLRWFEEVNASLVRRQACFKCNHALESIEKHNVLFDGGRAIIPGEPWEYSKGYGGSRFIITLKTNYIITNNLWSRGVIPIHLHSLIPQTRMVTTKDISSKTVIFVGRMGNKFIVSDDSGYKWRPPKKNYQRLEDFAEEVASLGTYTLGMILRGYKGEWFGAVRKD